MSFSHRQYSAADRALIALNQALAVSLGPASPAQLTSPAATLPEPALDESARRHAAGLMRVNHAGEVSAQALYLGQAAVARSDKVRDHLLEAAREEADHLAWCAERLQQLDSRPSLFNPLWYAGSYALGAAAGLLSDRLSLGFVVETERQVEAHLGDHLQRLPAADARSRAIVSQMQADEARHGEEAAEAGAAALPEPAPRVMQALANVMRTIAYRL